MVQVGNGDFYHIVYDDAYYYTYFSVSVYMSFHTICYSPVFQLGEQSEGKSSSFRISTWSTHRQT